MPLYDRSEYLAQSINTIADWTISKKIYFFQDNIRDSSCAFSRSKIDRVQMNAINLSKERGIPFEFMRRGEHLGIRKNITRSISESFENSLHLFCVEDDVVVSPSFPDFCLKHLESEEHLIINANRFTSRQDWAEVLVASNYTAKDYSSWYSNIFRTWGWFCSRNIWQDYLPDSKLLMTKEIVQKICHLPPIYINSMKRAAKLCNTYELDSWAVPFQYYLWNTGKKILSPFVNMSSHIGIHGRHFSTSKDIILGSLHYQNQPYYRGPISSKMVDISSNEVSKSREVDEHSYIFGGNKYDKLKKTYYRDAQNLFMEFLPIY